MDRQKTASTEKRKAEQSPQAVEDDSKEKKLLWIRLLAKVDELEF